LARRLASEWVEMAYLLVPQKKQIRKVPLNKNSFFIGRGRENDLTFVSNSLSRFHAQINRKGNAFSISDRGSLNGVFVNGARILAETKLQDGDILGLGEIHLRFCLEENELFQDREKTHEKLQRFAIEKLVDSRHFEPEKKQRYLDLLYDLSARLLQQFPSSDLSEVALEIVHDVWKPDRSCLMTRESGEWQISTQRFGKNPQLTGESFEISSSLIGELEKNHEALLVENRFADRRFQASESLQKQNVSSILCAPLWNNKKVFGFLYADLIMSERSFAYSDLEMFAILANLIAMKMENDQFWHQALIQQQLEQELNLAGEIQKKFFPVNPPSLKGYSLSAITIPTRKVGGDAYFWHERKDGKLVVMVADVMGKGLPSALLMSQVQAIMKIFSEQYREASQIVTAVNEFIYKYSTQEKFISMVVTVLDPSTGTMTFCNAGHNPPFILKPQGGHSLLHDGGLPVGVFLDQPYSQGESALLAGETMVLYTDGLTEARNAEDEEFGLDQLVESARGNLALPVQAMAEAMITEIHDRWLGTDQEDDWTLLILKRHQENEMGDTGFEPVTSTV
jgi:sigma-B regulation protein RsbU (phosphoserine phosphatase)